MTSPNPTIEQIQQMLSRCSGKTIWGAKAGPTDLACEIGETWKNPKNGQSYGTFGLFVNCPWEIRRDGQAIASSGDERTEEWGERVESALNDQVIRVAMLTKQTHELTLQLQPDAEFLIRPNPDEDEWGSWSFFYVDSPSARLWCTFNGVKIRYNN